MSPVAQGSRRRARCLIAIRIKTRISRLRAAFLLEFSSGGRVEDNCSRRTIPAAISRTETSSLFVRGFVIGGQFQKAAILVPQRRIRRQLFFLAADAQKGCEMCTACGLSLAHGTRSRIRWRSSGQAKLTTPSERFRRAAVRSAGQCRSRIRPCRPRSTAYRSGRT